jgi:hypothetical protein
MAGDDIVRRAEDYLRSPGTWELWDHKDDLIESLVRVLREAQTQAERYEKTLQEIVRATHPNISSVWVEAIHEVARRALAGADE